MRAVVVSAWPPWLAGHGGSLILQHHLRQLAGRHDITLLSAGARVRRTAPPPDADPSVPTTWFGTATPPALDYAVRRSRATASGEPAHVWYVERPALLAALRAELDRRPDLVYGFGWGTGRLHRLAGAIPVVHAAVDAWDLGRAGRILPGWRRVVDAGETAAVRRHQRRHYPQLAAVTTVADLDAAHLRRAVPAARVEVVPNGVELGPPPAPLPADPVIGFHGNFESRHNVEAALTLAVEVFPAVRAVLPEARLLLAGRTPPAGLLALADDAVTVVADPPAIRPVLDEMSVEVVLMSTGSGVKNKVLEAMAAGRPVIGNRLGLSGVDGGVSAVAGAGAGGGVVEVGSAGHAAGELIRLLQAPDRLAELGRQARARAERDFSWSGSADRLEAVWHAAIERAAAERRR